MLSPPIAKIHNVSLKIPPPLPRCAVLAKNKKKRRIIAYNTLGPFPDEPLTTGIDRVLYFLGGRTMQKYFNMVSPSSSGQSDCSLSVRYYDCPKEHEPYRKHRTYIEEYCGDPEPTYEIIKKSKCPKCQSSTVSTTTLPSSKHSSRKSSPRINMAEPLENEGYLRKSVERLRRSFSLCSLACRKFKQKWLKSKEDDSSRWLWTKLQDFADGCQVYETSMTEAIGDSSVVAPLRAKALKVSEFSEKGEKYVIVLDEDCWRGLEKHIAVYTKPRNLYQITSNGTFAAKEKLKCWKTTANCSTSTHILEETYKPSIVKSNMEPVDGRNVKTIPPILGPFADESFAICIDRFVYFANLLMGCSSTANPNPKCK